MACGNCRSKYIDFSLYLRLVINMYMKEEENALISSFNIIVIGLIWIMAAMMIILGIIPGFLLEITAEAANFTS